MSIAPDLTSTNSSFQTGATVSPVIRSIRVRANAARAFEVFTSGMETWWPRTHHIGKSPMRRALVEGWVGGRCYSEQEDGTDCPWGEVIAWEPPTRFVMAWKVRPNWEFEPDLSKCSEVEVTFTAQADGSTEVVLKHHHFERHGEGGAHMQAQVSQQGGWGGLMLLYQTSAEVDG